MVFVRNPQGSLFTEGEAHYGPASHLNDINTNTTNNINADSNNNNKSPQKNGCIFSRAPEWLKSAICRRRRDSHDRVVVSPDIEEPESDDVAQDQDTAAIEGNGNIAMPKNSNGQPQTSCPGAGLPHDGQWQEEGPPNTLARGHEANIITGGVNLPEEDVSINPPVGCNETSHVPSESLPGDAEQSRTPSISSDRDGIASEHNSLSSGQTNDGEPVTILDTLDGTMPTIQVTPPKRERNIENRSYSHGHANNSYVIDSPLAQRMQRFRQHRNRRWSPDFESPSQSPESPLWTNRPRCSNDSFARMMEGISRLSFNADTEVGDRTHATLNADDSFFSEPSRLTAGELRPRRSVRSFSDNMRSRARDATAGSSPRSPSASPTHLTVIHTFEGDQSFGSSSSKFSIRSGLSFISTLSKRFWVYDGSPPTLSTFKSHAELIREQAKVAVEEHDRILYFAYAFSFYSHVDYPSDDSCVNLLLSAPVLHQATGTLSHRLVGSGLLHHHEEFKDEAGFVGLKFSQNAETYGTLWELSEQQLRGLVAWDEYLYPNFQTSMELETFQVDDETGQRKKRRATDENRDRHQLARIKVRVDGPGNVMGYVPCVTWV